MPSNPLDSILRDTGPYSAEYRPVSIDTKPATGCDVPAPVISTLTLPPLPTISNNLECNINFIPTPVVVPPFVPPFEDIAVPCPSGFHFEAQFTPAALQCITQSPAASGFRPLVCHNFIVSDTGIGSDTDDVLPDLAIYIPITPSGTDLSGANEFPITADLRYLVVIAGYDPSTMQNKGIAYFDSTGTPKVYKNGQSFKGIVSQPYAAVDDPTDNPIVSIKNVQHRRILDYDRALGGSTLYVHQDGFILPSSGYSICEFVLHRLVIGTDPDKETGGGIRFVNEDCGGKLIGEININIDDLNIPCEDGFLFDAGYSGLPGEVLTVTGGVTVSSGGTVDLIDLVPTGVSPASGQDYPMPTLRVRVSTGPDVWQEAVLSSVNIGGTWTLASGLPNGVYSTWYLQRINVVSSGSTGGQLEFIKRGDCGGRLVGEISVNPPSLHLPCETEMTSGSLVNVGANRISSTDKLRSSVTPTSSGWPSTLSTTKSIGLSKNFTSCNYSLNFDSSQSFDLPNIQILLNLDNQDYRFTRVYDAPNDVVRFEATIDRGTDPGGGTGSGTACLNCCRWS